jgi:hypothetical protein
LTAASLRLHPLSIAAVSLGVVAVVGVFTFARPTSHPAVLPPPPGAGLPYTHVTFTARDAQRAFADVGMTLVRHENGRTPPIADMSTKDDVVSVDTFGDARKVAASGFSDYLVFANGHWAHAPRTCVPGAVDAERWRGNVRVIVRCTRAGSDASHLLRLAARALARL